MNERKISSSWTKPMLVLMVLVWVIGIPAVIFSGRGDFDVKGHLGVFIIYLIFVGITLYLTWSLSSVKFNENEIKFKKVFGSEKIYSFGKIGQPSSFRLKRLKFTSVKMEGASGHSERYLILNNNALLSGEDVDAEEILGILRNQKK